MNQAKYKIDYKLAFDKKSLDKIPHTPGVYMFLDDKGKVIYVGKARDLHRRVSSYFNKDVLLPKTREMVRRAKHIWVKLTISELEALLLESSLVKLFSPRYNAQLKDDKSFPWIYVVKQFVQLPAAGAGVKGVEDSAKLESDQRRAQRTRHDTRRIWYPVVKIVRDPDFERKYFQRIVRSKAGVGVGVQRSSDVILAKFGPFIHATRLREALRALRRLFAFPTCSKAKFLRHYKQGRACLYGQMGLCPAPCVSQQGLAQAKKQARELIKFLKMGHSRYVEALHKKMHKYAQNQEFEKALLVRNTIERVNRLSQLQVLPELVDNPNFAEDIQLQRVQDIRKIFGPAWRKQDKNIHESAVTPDSGGSLATEVSMPEAQNLRIEAYDNSSLQGLQTTSSMVVSINGVIVPGEYKRFKQNKQKEAKFADVFTMREVILRRLGNKNWGLPDIWLVDGGRVQLIAVYTALLQKILDLPKSKIQRNLQDFLRQAWQVCSNTNKPKLKSEFACKVLKNTFVWGIYKPYDFFVGYIPHLQLLLGDAFVEYLKYLQSIKGIVIATRASWLYIKPRTRQLGIEHLRHLRDEAHRFAKKYHAFLRDKIAPTQGQAKGRTTS